MSGHKGRLRSTVPIVLLIMILMRLVWMQLRSYPAQTDTRALISLETLLTLPVASRCDASRTSYRAALAPSPSTTLMAPPVQTGPLTGPTLTRTVAPPPPPSSALLAARAFLASPGYVAVAYAACALDALEDRWALKANQWLFVLTVLCAAVTARIITSSWTIGLASATVVFSRGRLLADIGLITPDYMVMFWLTASLMAATHMLRTGARITLLAMAAALFCGAVFERAILALFLLFPALLALGSMARGLLTRPIIQRLRGTNRRLRALNHAKMLASPMGATPGLVPEPGPFFVRLTHSVRDVLGLEFPEQAVASWRLNYDRGSLFRTLSLPFMIWAYWQRRWLRLSLLWLALGTLSLLGVAALHRYLGGPHDLNLLRHLNQDATGWVSPLGPWLLALIRPLDLHLAVSLGLLCLCAMQSPASGLPSFFEWSWLLLLAIVLLLVSAFLADNIDFQIVHSLVEHGSSQPALLHLLPRRLMLWLEPTILSCGVACLYNLMKVLDTRIGGRS